MPVDRITKKQLDSWLANPPKKQTDYFESRVPGFHVRVSPGGAASFCLAYRFENRKRRFKIARVGDLDLAAARAEAEKLRTQIASGVDPQSEKLTKREKDKEKHSPENTVKGMLKDFLKRYVRTKSAKSYFEQDRFFERDVYPLIGDVPLEDVKRKHIQRVIDTVVERGSPVSANRLFAYLRKAFTWAVEKDLLENTPCFGVDTPGKKAEKPRDVVLKKDDLKPVWYACSKEGLIGQVLRLVLATGCRPGEARQARWSDIDLKGRWWTIPAEHSKNGQPNRVWLNDVAVNVINRAKRKALSGTFLFPGRVGNEPIKWIAKGTERVRDRTKVEFTAHDLRRTTATFMTGELGISREIVGKILNHAETGVIAVYDRASYDKPKKQASETWSNYLVACITKKKADDKSNVVPLHAS